MTEPRPWDSKLLGREWAELRAWVEREEQRKQAALDDAAEGV
jgi:hypothetical protein